MATKNSKALTYGWVGGLVGNWQDAANWATGPGMPATAPPGAADTVIFDSPSAQTQEIDGTGSADSLTLNGSNFITAQLSTQTLDDTGALSLDAGAHVSAASATLGANASLSANGARTGFSVSQTLTVQSLQVNYNQAVLSLSNGALIQAGNLDLQAQGSISVDATSAVEIGRAPQGAPPAPGAVTIDPGATLSVEYGAPSQVATFTTVVDDGTISIPFGGRALFNINVNRISIATLSGSGTVEDGGSLTVGSIAPGSLDVMLLPTGYSRLYVTGSVGVGNVFDLSASACSLGISASPISGLYNTMAGTIANFSPTSSIELTGRTVTSVVYTAASGTTGTLSFLAGFNPIGSVALTRTYSNETFIVGNRYGDNNTITLTPGTFSSSQGTLSIATTAGATSSLGDIESQLSSKPTQADASGPGTLAFDTVANLSGLDIGAGTTVALDQNFPGQIATTQIDAGGTLENDSVNPYTLDGNLTGTGTVLTGSAGSFTFDGAVASGLTVAVAPSNGLYQTFALDLPGLFDATIAGFAAGDSIGLYSDGHPITATQSGNSTVTTVTLTQDGGTLASLRFAGDFTNVAFSATSATLTATEIACFCRGTRILTPQGEICVEALAIGQRVTTLSGASRPIKWIGTRRYAAPFVHANEDIHPIRIARDALSEGVPASDLFVSPLHALYLDRVLVPARLLVNGRGITQVHDRALIEYFHVELDSHDILLANGAPAESFVDCDSRSMFANAGEFDRLYPDDDSQGWAFCAPRIEDGARLARILASLEPHAAPARREPVRGHLDFLDREQVGGWAWMPRHPNDSVTLEIATDAGVIGRTVANRLRTDVKTAGFGTGRYGFLFRFPAPLGSIATVCVHVRAIADGTDLAGSPGTLPAAAVLTPEMYPALEDALLAGAAQASTVAQIDQTIAFLLGRVEALRDQRDKRTVGASDPGSLRPLAIVIDDQAPDPSRSAGGQALLSHMRSLTRLGYRVLFAALDMRAGLREEPFLRECAAPRFRAVEEVLRRHGNDATLVYLHRVSNADRFSALVRHTCPRAHLVFAVADLHFLRLARQAQATGSLTTAREAHAMLALETLLAARADSVITHSAHEATLLAKRVPGARVRVVPWQIDIPAAAPIDFAERVGIAFIGGWSHAPNQDAIRFLLEELLPRLNRMRPMIPCLLIGEGLPRDLRRTLPAGVEILGQVCDLAACLKRVRLTVAPLRFGAGIKGKVLESFAHGLPCVMTPIAAEGLPLDALLRDCVATEPDDLVALIRTLHHDDALATRVGRAGLALVTNTYSADALDRSLSGIGRHAMIRRDQQAGTRSRLAEQR